MVYCLKIPEGGKLTKVDPYINATLKFLLNYINTTLKLHLNFICHWDRKKYPIIIHSIILMTLFSNTNNEDRYVPLSV